MKKSPHLCDDLFMEQIGGISIRADVLMSGVALDASMVASVYEDEFKNQKNTLIAEKGQIEAEIRKVEQGVNDWMDLTEKTFEFATYAKAKFEEADFEGKTQILAALGQNFSLFEGKLDITLAKPFLILKNGLSGVSLQKVASEPALYLDLQRENAPLGGVNFSWSR